MDFLIAKVKRSNTYFLVLSNKTVYERFPSFEHTYVYDDDRKLHEEEWFVLDNFKTRNYCPDIVKQVFSGIGYSYLARDRYKDIKYVISIQEKGGKHFFLFQNITTSYIYKKYKALSWENIKNPTDQAVLIKKEGLIVLKENPDAYYCLEDNNLYFKELSSITSIFRGINELYREATDDEVTEFMELDMIDREDDFNNEKVKTQNRRKIKEALDRYNNFDSDKKAKMPSYIKKYCHELYDENTNKFKVSSEDDLTKLLNIINQRYYTTELDGEKRLANSVTILNQ